MQKMMVLEDHSLIYKSKQVEVSSSSTVNKEFEITKLQFHFCYMYQ